MIPVGLSTLLAVVVVVAVPRAGVTEKVVEFRYKFQSIILLLYI